MLGHCLQMNGVYFPFFCDDLKLPKHCLKSISINSQMEVFFYEANKNRKEPKS